MSATTTGVAAALTSVPEPQIREAANDAAADAAREEHPYEKSR
jgi:hypothetical protein